MRRGGTKANKMIYYRVKPSDDQRKRINKRREICGIYIANELLTACEAERNFYDVNRLQKIETSRKNTYFFFGARFAADESRVKTIV